MRFAVCDDDEINLRYLSLLIGEYLQKNNYEITLDSYISPDSLLRLVEENGANPYTAVFMDINLGNSLGTDVARELRETDRKFYLIFITGHTNYMAESFELHTYDYVQKPLGQEKLYRLLDRLLMDINTVPTITFTSDHRTIALPVDDIQYIMGRRNGSTLYTESHEYRSRMTMKDLSVIVKPPVCRCHNGYYVNIAHIAEIRRKVILLQNGHNIPIGRSYCEGFLRGYNLFK